MQLFEQMFLNTIYLLFPLLLYLVYLDYIKNLDLKEKNMFLELAIFSSLFLMIRYGQNEEELYAIMFLNIPLLIAYLKDKKFIAIVISIVLIFYYSTNYYYLSFLFLICEYLLYYVTYNYLLKRKLTISHIINVFVIIKSFIIGFCCFYTDSPNESIVNNLLYVFSIMLIFTMSSYLILYFIKKCENIIDLNITLKELEKEKSLRTSLFKITHEVKNPIAVVKGYLEMFDYSDQTKIRKYIPIIKEEIERTLLIINDFSDYGKIKIEKDIIELNMLIEEIENSLAPLFKKNNSTLTVKMKDDELYLDADYNRLKQVLVNILKNSIEARIEDTHLQVNMTIKEYKKTIGITIKDNGQGMNKDDLKRVDEIFYTTKSNGTGLGVALSKEIIEMHKGSIKYTSVINKGTTVSIILPK